MASIPLPADATSCVEGLGALAPEGRACLYVPELPCPLEVAADAPCSGDACAIAGWSTPSCTRGGEPVADLPRGAVLDATLRFVAGPSCPAHEDVFATGAARPCTGSGLGGTACYARVDFRLKVTEDGGLAPLDDRALGTVSALLAEERRLANEALPCDAEVEPSETGIACVALRGDGGGSVRVDPLSDLSCAGTSTTACPELEITAGRELVATASAAACARFDGFSGACQGSSCRFTVRAEATCEANRVEARFVREALALDLSIEGEGEVRIEPFASACSDEADCPAICRPNRPCRVQVPCGQAPELIASAGAGYALSSWGAPSCSVDQSTCTLPAFTASRQLSVRFAAGEQTLGVDPRGVCAERISGPSGLDCGSGAVEPGDCERRVAELSAVRLDLDSTRGARVHDWGVDCAGLANCNPASTRLEFTMPTEAVRLAPVVAYPLELEVEGPGEVEIRGPNGAEGQCSDQAPCADLFTPCDGQRTLRSTGRTLGSCTSRILSWEVDGQARCGDADDCALPLPTDRLEATARFGLPVPTRVIGPGTVDVGGTPCTAGSCDGPDEAPVFAADAMLSLEADREVLCVEGCDSPEFERNRCRLTNDVCRAPSITLGRRVAVSVAGDCSASAPAPTPRSGGNRSCRDEGALSVSGPAGRAERVYASTGVQVIVRPDASDVRVVDFQICDLSGNCTAAPVPAPQADGSFRLGLSGTDDVEARVVCEAVYAVEVQPVGPGQVDDSRGGSISSCRASSGVCVDQVPGTRTVALSVQPDAGARFFGWRALQGSLPCAADANPCSFRALEDVVLEPTFRSAFPLQVSVSGLPAAGGQVRSTTAGTPTPGTEILCPGTCSVARFSTQTVQLEAVPDAGYRFDGWTGPCTPAGSSPCTVATLDRARTVSARFVAEWDLSATATGGDLRLDGSPCPAGVCSGTFDHGTSATLEVVPPAGSHDVVWGGDCAGSVGNFCSLSFTADRNATVTVTPLYLDVALTVTGTVVTGARVSSAPTGLDCSPVNQGSCSARFDLAQSVLLTADAVSDTRLTWGGDCAGSIGATCSLDAQGSPTSVSRSASAAYTALAYLEVQLSGRPGLSVDSTPAGIAGCEHNTGVCTASFDAGSSVRLTVSGSTTAVDFGAVCTPLNASECELTLPAVRGVTETVRIRR